MSISASHDDQPVDRTVVVIGRTGNGKSALANAIAGRFDGDLFSESASPHSRTRGTPAHIVTLDHEGRTYRVRIVDTNGFGDTDMSEKDVLLALADLARTCDGGIHHVFFVTKHRFTAVEQEAFKLMVNTIFNPDVLPFVTVVRTHAFTREQDHSAKLRQFQEEMMVQLPSMASVRGFLMVNNPEVGEHQSLEGRQRTHRIFLDHILSGSPRSYSPPCFAAVRERVGPALATKDSLAAELKRLREKQASALPGSEEMRRLETEAAGVNMEMDKIGDAIMIVMHEVLRVAVGALIGKCTIL
eukprot:scpid59004/ scgid28268/ 